MSNKYFLVTHHSCNKIFSSWFFVFLFSFSLLFSVVWLARSVDTATPPSIITYQGKLLENGASVTTTKAMAFVIYDAASGGTALYTAAGTLPTTSTMSVTPTQGIFSVDLGGSGTNALDSTIFQDNDELYLEVVVDGTTLTPRKRLTASPYAVNSTYLNGAQATSTPQSTTYIPMSDIDGSFAFNTTTFFGDSTFASGTIRSYYQDFGGGNAGSFIDVGQGLSGESGILRLMSSHIGSLGGSLFLYAPSTTVPSLLTTVPAISLSVVADGTPTLVLGGTGSSEPGEFYIFDGSTTKVKISGDSSGSWIMDDLHIGVPYNTESITNVSFTMDGDDFYVEGDSGFNGNIFSDGVLDIAGTGTSTFAGSIDLASGKCFSVNGTCITGGSSQWTTNGSDIYFSSGNVGINTTSPMYDLAVSGDMFISATSTMASGSIKSYLDTSLGTSISVIDSGTGLNGSAGVFRAMSSNPNVGPAVVLYPISTTTIPGMTTGYAATFSVTTSNRPQLTLGSPTPSVGAGSIAIGAGGGSLGAYISGSTSEDSYLLNDFLLGAGIESIGSSSFIMNGNDFYVEGDTGLNGNIYIDGGLGVYGSVTSSFSGAVAIGTSTSAYLLSVLRSGDGIVAAFTDSDATCTVDPSDGDFSCTSDRNLKTNITVMGSTLDAVMQLNPVTYNWNTDPSGEVNYGFIAQEVEALFPRLVGTGANGYKTLSQIGLIPFLTKAIQEQQLQINTLSSALLQGSGADLTNGSFEGTLRVAKHVAFGEDTVGQIKLLSGATSVRVTFADLYEHQPIVTVSPLAFISGQYRVTEENEEGFTLELSESQLGDVVFNWHAFAGEGAKLTVSDGSFADITLVVVDQGEDLFDEEQSVEENQEIGGGGEPMEPSPEETPLGEEGAPEEPVVFGSQLGEEVASEPPVQEENTSVEVAPESVVGEGIGDEPAL